MHAVAVVMLSFLSLAAWPGAADAQVRRCSTDAGGTIYTDKPCREVGAVERVQPGANAGAPALHRNRCHRTLQELTFELAMAIDARDTNRVAALYHWPGTSTRSGYALMERLDAIAQRPLVDVRPLYPAEHPPAPTPTTSIDPQDTATDTAQPPSSSELMRRTLPWRPSAASTDAPAPEDGTVPATMPASTPAPAQRAAYALQVDQTLANGSTPSRTVFGLRRHLGCLWISL